MEDEVLRKIQYFKTGQYGKLYIIKNDEEHIVEIYIIPENKRIIFNDFQEPVNGVRVYYSGFREVKSRWLFKGKWQEDFYNLAEIEREKYNKNRNENIYKDELRIKKILEDY